jgi:hypothetical protein
MLAEITAVFRVLAEALDVQLLRTADNMLNALFSQNSLASRSSRSGNEHDEAVTAMACLPRTP